MKSYLLWMKSNLDLVKLENGGTMSITTFFQMLLFLIKESVPLYRYQLIIQLDVINICKPKELNSMHSENLICCAVAESNIYILK